MDATSALTHAFGIGVIAGLRSMMAPAVVSWAAHEVLVGIRVSGDLIGEMAGLSQKPRSATATACGRVTSVVLTQANFHRFLHRYPEAALSMAAKQSSLVGALLGGLGAVAGTLGGYEARTRLVKAIHGPDAEIAVLEDAVAIGGGVFLVSRVS